MKLTCDETRELLNRIEFEHEMLVSRTSAILTLNGLFAASVGIGTNLPQLLKLVMVIIMILLNFLWLLRAASASGWIDDVTRILYLEINKDVLPVHAKLHNEHIKKRLDRKSYLRYYSSQSFFSVGIPFGLLIFWFFALLIWK